MEQTVISPRIPVFLRVQRLQREQVSPQLQGTSQPQMEALQRMEQMVLYLRIYQLPHQPQTQEIFLLLR